MKINFFFHTVYGRSWAPSNIDEDESETSSSTTSDNNGNDTDTGEEKRKKSGASSRRSSNKSTRYHHQNSKKSSEAEESAHSKNSGKTPATPTPSTRRKIVLYERVQKYINQKRHRKHSLDFLDDESQTRRSISAGDLLDADYMKMVQEQNPKRKTKSFKMTSSTSSSSSNKTSNSEKNKNPKKSKSKEIIDAEQNEANERDTLLMFNGGRRERASTLGDMDELPMQVSSRHPSWLEINQNNNTNNNNDDDQQQQQQQQQQQRPPSSPDENNEPPSYSKSLSKSSSFSNDNNKHPSELPLTNGSAYTIIDGTPESPGNL